MKLAFILKDIGLNEIDMSNPQSGNPGIGGSEFLFVLLMYYLLEQSEHRIICYHFEDNKLPKGIECRCVKNIGEVLFEAEREQVDFLVYQLNWGKPFYDMLKKSKINAIAWAHCYISKDELGMMSEIENVRRVVCVGREQYDTYIDHPAIEKMSYIYNMVPMTGEEKRIEKHGKNIVFIGSITRGKGFDIFAKAWPKIKKKAPDTHVYVIGSGKLYDRGASLGKYGIADEAYEREFIPYLLDESGNLDGNFHFLGVLGEEKNEYIKKCAVGVTNPSVTRPETFGLVAVEMGIYGVPVATSRMFGRLDTVIHKKTGLLHYTTGGLAKNIVKMLNNDDINLEYGQNAKQFVNNTFSSGVIMPKWLSFFADLEQYVQKGTYTKACYQKPKCNFLNDFKWLRIINRFMRFNMRMKFLPPICNVKRTL